MTRDWIFGGGGHPIGGNSARLRKLVFSAANARSWFIWDTDGQLLAFGDAPQIDAAAVKLEGGVPTLVCPVPNNICGANLSGVVFPSFPPSTAGSVTPFKIVGIDLDNIRSISGPDNADVFVGSKAGVPSVAIDLQPAIPIADLTSDRYDADWFGCSVSIGILSPQRADAGKALVVRRDGSTVFAATTDGVAACQGARLIMDGKLYDLPPSEVRTELATLSTSSIDSAAWTIDDTVVIVTDNTLRLLDRDGKLLASQFGVVGHVLPELVGAGAPIPLPAMTFTVRDDIALRFDPQISDSDHTGEMRVTGHDSGDVALAIGSAIVSGKGDTVILQDPATGRWLDDRDTAFGVSSLAIHGSSLAIAEQLADSSVKIAEIIGGKLTFLSSYDLPDATTPAQVAWSASGTRLAIAYRAGDVVRIAVHHLDAMPELEWTYDAPAAATSGAPLIAWDLADERLAIGFSDGVALWTPGQTAPAPQLAIAATKLAWSPGHRLAIGDASRISVYAVDLQPVAVGISGVGDFAWSPSGRLALVDAGGVRVWSQGVLLPRQSLTFFEFQSELPLVVTRVGWIDDDHMVIVTDHGFVARYTVAAVP